MQVLAKVYVTIRFCVVQLLAIPPRAHDINQHVEHANGCAKAYAAKELNRMKGSIKDLSDQDVQDLLLEGANRYTSSSWVANTRRLVQCLRILCTPADTEINVKKTVICNGKPVQQDVTRLGTNGNYCYKDFS